MHKVTKKKVNFLNLFFLILKYLDRDSKSSLYLLALKTFFSGIFELLFIVSTGGLVYLFDKDASNNSQLFEYLKLDNLSSFQISIFFIAISLSTTLYMFYINYETIYISNKISNQITSKLINSFLKIEYYKYTEISTDKLIIASNYAQSLIKNIIAFIDIFKMLTTTIIISIGIYLTTQQNGLFLIALIFIIYSILLIKTKSIFLKLSKKLVELESELTQLINASYGGFRDIKFSGLTDYIRLNILKKDKVIKSIRAKIYILNIAPKSILEIMLFGCVGFFLILTSFNFNLIKTNTAELVIIAFAGIRLIPQLQKMFVLYSSLKSVSFQLTSLFDFIDFCSDDKDFSLNSKNVNLLKRHDNKLIELENVSYVYPNNKKSVLKDVNLKIYESEWIAIKGNTGSGKSTLLDIFLGLLKPNRGNINYFFSKNKIKLNDTFFNKYFSHVAQFPFLFIGDVYSNIVGYEYENINQNLLNKCLYFSCLDEDIKKGRLNIRDKVGERGGKLSGGQRQRIGIARALYGLLSQKKNILILDECTSALDHETSRKIMERLLEIKPRLTIILVTHRIDLLSYFDKIYTIDSKNVYLKK